MQYRTSTDSQEMIKGIHFEDIYKIYYCFDEEVRSLLRLYIEKAAFFYKDLIGNTFAALKCKAAPYDQHYDINNYYDKAGITSTFQNFNNDIAKQVGINVSTLENHLHALSVLSNKCSHGVRLYNSTINPPVKFNKSFLRKNPNIKNNTLFAYILMLIKRLPSDNERKQFRDKLNRLVKMYENNIDLNLIGFPKNYRQIMYIKNLNNL